MYFSIYRGKEEIHLQLHGGINLAPDVPLSFCTYSGDVTFDWKDFPMKTKTLTNPALNCSHTISLPLRDFPGTHLIQACSRDYGFDFDEEEFGMEILAPLPANLSLQATFEVDTDDFEQVLQCFLS